MHRVRALADGVEFAQVTVTVTTLGTPFVRGAMREVSVPDFPAAGTDVVLRWQQAQQNFVVTDGSPGQSGGTSGSPPRVLENPQPGSFQSGIGVISGWACEAGEITIEIEDGVTGQRATWVAGYRTSRGDTMGVCGDANNGFGLTYNWNLLGDGVHRVRALADGVEFAQVTVTVTTLGTPFVRGAMREVSVPDFPEAGTDVVLRWQQAQQNFVVTQTTSTPVSAHFLPDANLRRAVEEALGKSPGATITKVELATLRRLNASNYGIVDLTGLEFATNLASLYLSGNEIVDISPLAGLVNLTTLYLDRNEIVDLSPLAGLVNLYTLDISRTRVTELAPLFMLAGLTSLNINGTPVRQEDLDALTEAGVAIDGTPEVIFASAVGDVDIYHDSVIVLHLSELPVTREVTNPRSYARRIYEEFEDAFDYLMIVSNLDEKPEFLPSGLYSSVRNDTQGTGRRVHYHNQYGSEESLLGVAFFPYRAIEYGSSLHELMHTWANFAVQTSVQSHWGFSSAHGQLGGFSLRDLVHLGGHRYTVQSGFSTYANGGNSVPYSPIELYFAGLIPPDDVPDLWVAEDGEWLEENGKRVLSDDGWPIFTAIKVRTITIDDIIAEHGARVPDWTTSQKDFRAAAVLLVDDDHPATDWQIQEVSDHVSWFSHPGNDNSSIYNYYEATGGRGTITMDGLSQFLLSD